MSIRQQKDPLPLAGRKFFRENKKVHSLLKNAKTLQQARKALVRYVEDIEKKIRAFKMTWHPMLNIVATDAIWVLRNIFAKRHEILTGVNSLKMLWNAARGKPRKDLSDGFFEEFRHLFLAIHGKAHVYNVEIPNGVGKLKGRKAARARSRQLDALGKLERKYMKRYRHGLMDKIIERRKRNRKHILKYFKARVKDWKNYKWHFDNVITDADVLADLVPLSKKMRQTVHKAMNNRVPFGITPYYLSLFDREKPYYDSAVRAQVLPPADYVSFMAQCKNRKADLDFMGEADTSPVQLVTRRYPNILILKPYNACPQVCTYCQRNWEIDQVMAPGALAPKSVITGAIDWIKSHKSITEVLITGGDPLVLEDSYLDWLMGEVAKIDHIENIRLGTRTLVTVPFRITPEFVEVVAKYNEPGRRRISVVTHIENPYEITPEVCDAATLLKEAGISIYNQAVFTVPNSRRFEMSLLRRQLRLVGIDPYYTFNAKGHEEMNMLRSPVARLLQEQKEESRLMPGLSRTDEAVFNVPRLGKNHLRARQDRNFFMITADGSRVYSFHPWEKNIAIKDPYIIKDVPILEYLNRLEDMGEDVEDYQSIWYYY